MAQDAIKIRLGSYGRGCLEITMMRKEITTKEKRQVDLAVKKTIKEYGEVLKKLGKTIPGDHDYSGCIST